MPSGRGSQTANSKAASTGAWRRTGGSAWIQATYNPIFDIDGRPVKFVKFAPDITREKLKNIEAEGSWTAISRGQAIVEFDLDGNMLTANENSSA